MSKEERRARREAKEKKPFKETGFGKFLDKAGGFLKDKGLDVIELVAKASTGNIEGAIGEVKELLGRDDSPKAKELLSELDLKWSEMVLEFQLEVYKTEVEDRKSARQREVDITTKTGKRDILMLITGILGLGAFVFMIVAIVFKPELQDNKLLIHVLGMVEGVVLSIVYYFFGSSKGSDDKTELLGRK